MGDGYSGFRYNNKELKPVRPMVTRAQRRFDGPILSFTSKGVQLGHLSMEMNVIIVKFIVGG